MDVFLVKPIKPTDTHQYLLTEFLLTSQAYETSVPDNFAHRPWQICTNDHSFNKRKEELTNYKHKFISTEINKTTIIPRHMAL